MKIAIVGSRPEYTDSTRRRFTDETIRRHRAVREYVWAMDDEDVLVSGGADGVDGIAEDCFREDLGRRPIILRANWELHGRAAGPIRNKEIVDYCDKVVAFWDGRSRGTASTIRLTRLARKPLEVYGPDGSRMPHMESPLP